MKQITEYKVEELGGTEKIITGEFHKSGGHFEVKRDCFTGDGDICEITLTGGLNQNATIKIYGQWEFEEFTELINLIKNVG